MSIKKEIVKPNLIVHRERQRIEVRDKQLFDKEIKAFEAMGLELLNVSTLDEYCFWIMPENPKLLKWDLLRYVSVNPGLPYYSFYKSGGSPEGVVERDYGDILIVHSLPGVYWSEAESRGFLQGKPNVSFASGQVVFTGDALSGMNSMSVIYDRRVLDKIYTLFPYSDHDVKWEREVRAYEPISLDLALAVVPTERFLLREFNKWGQMTSVCGRGIMADLEKEYKKTGYLDVSWL